MRYSQKGGYWQPAILRHFAPNGTQQQQQQQQQHRQESPDGRSQPARPVAQAVSLWELHHVSPFRQAAAGQTKQQQQQQPACPSGCTGGEPVGAASRIPFSTGSCWLSSSSSNNKNDNDNDIDLPVRLEICETEWKAQAWIGPGNCSAMFDLPVRLEVCENEWKVQAWIGPGLVVRFRGDGETRRQGCCRSSK